MLLSGRKVISKHSMPSCATIFLQGVALADLPETGIRR